MHHMISRHLPDGGKISHFIGDGLNNLFPNQQLMAREGFPKESGDPRQGKASLGAATPHLLPFLTLPQLGRFLSPFLGRRR